MLEVIITDRWRETFRGGMVGMLLVANIDNSKRPTPLDQHKLEIESTLRNTFAEYNRADLLQLDVLRAYKNYYKAFNKTYHVQLQLESVIHKGKGLPKISPLVDAGFAAELETMILTAGHDADQLELPVTMDATLGGEAFTQMNGANKTLKSNDMVMKDAGGPVCTVIYGQDPRTPISPSTRRALYVAYVPAGIDPPIVDHHLEMIKRNVFLVEPTAEVEYQQVHQA